MNLVYLGISKWVRRDFQKHKQQQWGHLPWVLQLLLIEFLKPGCFLCPSLGCCPTWCGDPGRKSPGLLRALSLAQPHKPHRWGGERLAQECGWPALRWRPGADWEPKLTRVCPFYTWTLWLAALLLCPSACVLPPLDHKLILGVPLPCLGKPSKDWPSHQIVK